MDQSKSLIDVKKALAEKYERLSRLSGSKPARARLTHRAVKYRRQVQQMERQKNA